MSQRRKTRLLLYCHNAVGLGHIMRTVQVAEAVAKKTNSECTIITGCPHLPRIPVDAAVRVEALPPVRLTKEMRFVPLGDQTGGPVMEERANRIEAFAKAYCPDVFVTDHAPLGLGGELLPTLTAAARETWPTRFVWALRDIQVAPQHAARMMRPPANPKIRTALGIYWSALGYSDKDWIDPFEPYQHWFLPARRDYVGVVARRILPSLDSKVPTVVSLSGGGVGGANLFRLVMEAALPLIKDNALKLRFVMGFFGSTDPLKVPEALRERVELVANASTQEAVRDASIVVSRVGYNTAYTLVQTRVPLVFVPLAALGDEQTYRAHMLATLPGISVVDESSPEAVAELRAALLGGLRSANVQRELPFRIDGAERAADLLMAISG